MPGFKPEMFSKQDKIGVPIDSEVVKRSSELSEESPSQAEEVDTKKDKSKEQNASCSYCGKNFLVVKEGNNSFIPRHLSRQNERVVSHERQRQPNGPDIIKKISRTVVREKPCLGGGRQI